VKARISPKLIALVAFMLLLGSTSFAQRKFNTHKSGSIWRHWYVKGNFSVNAMFGDVTSYDTDPFKKIGQESAIGFTASAGKWITEWGGAEFTFSKGNLYGFSGELEANTTYNQYTISGIVNFTQLIYPSDYQTPFYVYGRIGYGLIDLNAVLTNSRTGDTIRMQGAETSWDKRVSEWVIPMGIGGGYNFDANFALIFDVNYFYVDTDKLDGKFISSDRDFNDNKDSYASFTIGLKYTFSIKETQGSFNRPKSRRTLRFTR
jgi:hypothetical protein